MKNTGAFFFIVLLAAGIPVSAQVTGCTDPQAVNYNASATVNDGSCIYSTTNHTAPVITPIAGVNESSGLVYAFGSLWTHNDSGGAPEIYAVDTVAGTVVQTLVIRNAVNTDWEEITAGDGKIFIGDFGNNAGTRTDLTIYMVDSAQWVSPVDSADAQAIHFSWPDQSDFSGSNPNHNFDCEAMIYAHDTLTLFTKNRGDQWTKRYTVPALPGNYVASLADSFNVNGLITGASRWGDSMIVLCGYLPPFYTPFLWMLWDYQPGMPFSGNKRRLELGSVAAMGQMEGIALSTPSSGVISSEEVGQLGIPARLYRLDIGGYLSSQGLGMKDTWMEKLEIRRVNGTYYISSGSETRQISYSLYNASGALLCRVNDTMPCTIRCIPDTAGLYIVKISGQGGIKETSREFIHPGK